MISVLPARSAEDFVVAEALCQALGAWDATVSPAHGVSAAEVIELFHSGADSASLAEQFGAPDAGLFIARLNGEPAGSLGFEPFDDETAELGRFYVDPAFRGRGIGGALMQAVLDDIAAGQRRRVVLHTTPYMSDAVALYRRFGFTPCPRFRDTPQHVAHTDVFMARDI